MSPLRMILAMPAVVAATLLVALAWPDAPVPAPVPAAMPTPAPAQVSTTVGVDPAVAALHAWDRRRAAAWAAGDVAALRALYAADSRAGRADAALLREYVARGISVTGLRMQLLAVEVVACSPGRCVLVVTDRLARVIARHRGRTLDLPEDRPSTHRVTLVRQGGGWRIGEVYPAR